MIYVDFDTYNFLGMDVMLDGGLYNLNISFMKLNSKKEVESGMVIKTTIFEKTLQEIFNKIKSLIELNIFGNLKFLSNGHVLNSDGEIIDSVNWKNIGKITGTDNVLH